MFESEYDPALVIGEYFVFENGCMYSFVSETAVGHYLSHIHAMRDGWPMQLFVSDAESGSLVEVSLSLTPGGRIRGMADGVPCLDFRIDEYDRGVSFMLSRVDELCERFGFGLCLESMGNVFDVKPDSCKVLFDWRKCLGKTDPEDLDVLCLTLGWCMEFMHPERDERYLTVQEVLDGETRWFLDSFVERFGRIV